MKNLTVWIVIATVLGLVLYFVWQRSPAVVNQDLSESSQSDTVKTQRSDIEKPESRYRIYSKNSYESSADKKRVLYFYANWCPICRPIDTELREKEALLPEDAVIFRVNYNDPETDAEEKALADKHMITYQHTFVLLDAQGESLKVWNTGGLDTILEMLR